MDGVVKAVSPRYDVLHLTFLRFAVTAAMGGLLFLVLRAPLPDRGVIIWVRRWTQSLWIASLRSQ